MRELVSIFRDFFNKLFFRNKAKLVSSGTEWQTFTLFNPDNVPAAVLDLRENGWTVDRINYLPNFQTAIVARRETL